ncbi:MAG: YdjY domain-containing protein [Planctomycetota bacterium]
MKKIRFAGCVFCAALLALCAAISSAPAQEKVPETKPATGEQDPVAAMMKTFADAGLVVDTKQGTIRVPCVMGRPADPLEFVLVHRRGKSHETLLVTDVKASILNGAMLLLGFKPGENARSVEKNPLPTPEEVAKGAPLSDLFPPKGMSVWMTAQWKKIDEDGKEKDVEVPVEDMILDMATERSIEDVDWIYLGGNMAPMYRNEPPVFIGDYEGNLVSNVYRSPPNHLVTIKHAAADDDERWWITDIAPPADTPITLVIHKAKTPQHIARDERIAKRRAEEAKEGKKDGTGSEPAPKPERKGG